MPLSKRSTTETAAPLLSQAEKNVMVTVGNAVEYPKTERIGGMHKAGDKANAPLTKDSYWDRKEERDIQRDKDMAWSGLAQAAISSPYVAQFNMENTEDGLVALVVRITDKLLKARDEHNRG